MRAFAIIPTLFILFALQGCSLFDPSSAPRLGLILVGGEEEFGPPLQVPEQVEAGVPFEATVTSIGGNSCWERHRKDIVRLEGAVWVTVYDRKRGRDACFDAILPIESVAQLTLDQPGTYNITLVGDDFRDGQRHETTYTITVTVQ